MTPAKRSGGIYRVRKDRKGEPNPSVRNFSAPRKFSAKKRKRREHKRLVEQLCRKDYDAH